ncbi:MAG: DUF58 domain-containing protein [Chloroflexi bacterium]|nr:DUF58 domain-containing protein [Chloroflexota bacterium]
MTLLRSLIPRWRLLWLALAALAPLAFGDLLPGLQWLSLPLLVGVLGLVAVDVRMTASPDRLTVRRQVADRLSLGAENAVTLMLENRGPRPLAFRLRDEHPFEFRANQTFHEGTVPVGDSLAVRYILVPPRRGDYRFGRVVVRYRSALGLVDRQHAYPLDRDVRVYPNLLDLRRYDLLVRRGLEMEAGTRVARRFGAGTELERLREYVPDDELRRINWKATARRGIAISNEYETERSQNVVVLLDAGRLMGAVADGLTKLDHALNAGLLLTYAAGRRGDRVSLLAYADTVKAFLPPQKGRRAFLSILETLYRLEPELTESDHARAFTYLHSRGLRRSLLVLFTDLSDPEPSRALVAHLARAARQHLVAVVTVADPSLTGPAAREPRDAQQLYEQVVAQRLLDERRHVLASLSGQGVITLDLPADRLSAQVVATYLELKARGRL